METAHKILERILKDITIQHTVSSLAKETGLSRVGAWKILKKLEADKLIILKQIGLGKTSIYTAELNRNNVLTEKNLGLLLAEEAQNNQRWVDNFKELEKEVDFLILFGSILHSPKEAKDIDILIVADKKNLSKINETISKIQKSQIKEIHSNNLTETEFKEEMINKNKIFTDAIRKGVVLYGQERFIKIIEELKRS
jgi:DNA-binding Lrp family transcriptional regulator